MIFTGDYLNHLPNLQDPHEGKALKDIPKLSGRVRSLILRNKHKVRDTHDFAQTWGSTQFLQGLEYHYGNFLSHLQTLATADQLGDDFMLDHEAVAYLHRLGQFYYFCKSMGQLSHCPKITELYLFRKKSIGHRSIDAPREDDNKSEQAWQAGCFMRRAFRGWVKPGFDPKKITQEDKAIWSSPKRYLRDDMFLSYQILSNGEHTDFILLKDYPIISKEIEEAYTALFNSRDEVHP